MSVAVVKFRKEFLYLLVVEVCSGRGSENVLRAVSTGTVLTKQEADNLELSAGVCSGSMDIATGANFDPTCAGTIQ